MGREEGREVIAATFSTADTTTTESLGYHHRE
jgi:hypothetical protein